MSLAFEPVATCQGEAAGLIWREDLVLFCAVDESRILSFNPSSGAVGEFRRYTSRTSALSDGPDGHLYGAQSGSRRIVRFNADGSTTPLLARLHGRIHNHPRDLSVDSSARIWFSDPHSQIPAPGPQVHGRLEHASVLRLRQLANRSLVLERMASDTTNPEAVQISPDSSRLFVTDNDPSPSGRRELRSYPIAEDGSLGSPIVLHTFGADARGPHRGGSGMGLGLAGELFLCAGSVESGPGPMIYVFSLEGQLLTTHSLPETPVSCCIAPGSIYVTTLGGRLLRASLA
ncbi:MAG: SMP-30/gluconolactonase/LRE family protein [Candidatus Dormibacteraceae bacterium]